MNIVTEIKSLSEVQLTAFLHSMQRYNLLELDDFPECFELDFGSISERQCSLIDLIIQRIKKSEKVKRRLIFE